MEILILGIVLVGDMATVDVREVRDITRGEREG